MNLIGWIGAGSLGGALIRRLLATENPVLIYNRTNDKLKSFLELGARAARDLNQMALEVGLVGICVSDISATMNVVSELLKHSTTPLDILNFSTIGSLGSAKIRRIVEMHGSAYLECPVTGGPEGAEEGNLTVYISGPRRTYIEFNSIFRNIAQSVHYLGAGNEAQIVKVLNNAMEAVNLWGASEALVLGLANELELGAFSNALLAGRGSSKYYELLLRCLREEPDSTRTGVSLNIRRKDIDLAVVEMQQHGLDLQLFRAVSELFGEAEKNRGKYSDQTECFDFLLNKAKLSLLK